MNTKVKLHNTLNPKLWGCRREKRTCGNTTYDLRPEVSKKLVQIAHAFMDFLEVPKNAIEDYRIVGSSANFNYTKYSDIDLHIVVDYDKVHKDCPVVKGYLYAQKSLFNKEHDITIYGIPVEVYAESNKDQTVSNGVWSIKYDGWIQEPTKLKVDIDDIAVKAKYEELKEAINDNNSQEEAQKILDKIYKMRQSGLEEGGEFSVENIVFKKLRDEKLIEKLKKQIKISYDKKLSLKENYNQFVNAIAKQCIAEYLTR